MPERIRGQSATDIGLIRRKNPFRTIPSSESPNILQHVFDTGVSVDRANNTATLIEQEIQRSGGRIPYSKFMELSLFSPDGYYAAGKASIGYGRDFITSPEASEIFGATLGRTAMKVWDALDKPPVFNIIEVGAGQGTLAYSLLRWTEGLYPEFYKAIKYTILEYGTGLIPKQQANLGLFDVQWVRGSAYELPFRQVEGVFISNELPDAFPVEVVTREEGQIKQKYVSIENDKWVEAWEEPSAEVLAHIEQYGINIQEGVEEPINIQAAKLQKQLDSALKQGAVITIDYGYKDEVGEREQDAIRFYGPLDDTETMSQEEYRRIPYVNPGSVDITSSVNFRVLEQIAIQDGLKVGFSGLQLDLLLNTGVTDVIKAMKDTFRKIKVWPAAVALSRTLDGYQLLINWWSDFGGYYSHLLVKGIEPQQIDWDYSSRVPKLHSPRVPLSVGRTHQRVELDFSNVRGHSQFPNVPKTRYTGNLGQIWLPPHLVEGLRVYSQDGEKILDLTQEEQLSEAVKRMGYRYSSLGRVGYSYRRLQ